ncbi:30608_t:CDS:2 [Gigaspora margarita]|uniref:30608_t:CDS:1 n=1 Tax=Gigaspora margarita TaxID=4874 RepID=A0ABN7UL85_GIGMA|nr:30608_t:CDS:2 [Gigaspora margarita]
MISILYVFIEPVIDTNNFRSSDLYSLFNFSVNHILELLPVLEESIELINNKIKTYKQKILELSINAQKLEDLKLKKKKQPQQNQESMNFLNDIKIKIPEEEVPKIIDE